MRLSHEDIREYDDGEWFGWIGMHIFGHVADDEAVAYAWAEMADYGHDYSIAQPRQTWVRKVPREDGYAFVYSREAGRGAYPVTLVETAHSGWRYWCDKAGCESAYVRGSAQTGLHASAFEDAVNWFGRTRPEPQDPRQPEYWYVCRRHYLEYDEAHKAAVAERMAAYYRERDLAAAGLGEQ